jgi:hypothetical protein
MRWVRTNLRYGAWCAVLAMAVQLIVAFGHVHRTDAFRQAGFLLPATTQSAADDPAPPSKPIGLAPDFCAICVVAKIGAAMLPAEAPTVFAPSNNGYFHFPPHAQAAVGASSHRPFEARGPPFA